MPVNRLVVTIEATHQSLEQRLDEAMRHIAARSHPRDRKPRADALHAAVSRHVAAVDEVLLPVARRRLPDGAEQVKAYLHQARLLEQAMAELKARLYGQQHAAHLPWAAVWEEVRIELSEHNHVERELVGRLAERLDETESADVAYRLFRAEVRAPTRPHPYTPHTGLTGLVARRLWAVVDRFWDAAENRSVPRPVPPPSKEHAHDSLMAQYLVGEPLMDQRAPVFTHRRRRR